MRTILAIEVDKVAARLKAREIRLSVRPSAYDFLMAKGFDRQYGARQLRRAVERYLENVLAEDILRGTFGAGEIVEVEAGDDRLEFHPPKGETAAAEPVVAEAAPPKPPRRKKKDEGDA